MYKNKTTEKTDGFDSFPVDKIVDNVGNLVYKWICPIKWAYFEWKDFNKGIVD